ncbi:MAG: hypothetical protein B6240_04740 [Desulfobacteraceae bacterium 4572_87]|nr:MAG: hypothetical protein B6240_04740 [Desulfobacteraceae bacterium 4572_87]
MHQIRRYPLSISLVSLLAFLLGFGLVLPEKAYAGSPEGEDFITGLSLSDFDGVGHIDSREGDQLVIDDCSRELTSGVKYYKPGPIKIPASAFSAGSRVGYVENRDGSIVSLWLLPGK